MRRIGVFAAVLFAVFAVGRPSAQVEVPSLDARMSMGFNYDLLRPMTGVSFQYPVGYFGFSVPWIRGNMGDFLDSSTMAAVLGGTFKFPSDFKPTGYAEQGANYSVRVDVPMLAGVGTFAYTQNFYMNFNTALGGSSVIDTTMPINVEPDGGGVIEGFLAVRGALRLPLSFNMGWETMTFGYAYRVGRSDDLIFSLNMHRHLFSADIRVKADIDMLGYMNVSAKGVKMGDGDEPTDIPTIEGEPINFNSETCNGFAQGRFRAEGWTPAVGIKWKRFALNSRFGLDVKVKGSAAGKFVAPRVVDIETGKPLLDDKFKNLNDSMANPSYLFSMFDSTNGIIPNGLNSITYEIGDSFRWKMPQGHTLSFDIIPQKLTVSYTKLFGEVAVEIDSIIRTTKNIDDPKGETLKIKSLPINVGVVVDHILVLSAAYPSFFVNVGVSGFNVRNKGEYALGESGTLSALRVGDVVMLLPIINGGFNLGTKLQLRLEADILPLPAVRSGVNYYF